MEDPKVKDMPQKFVQKAVSLPPVSLPSKNGKKRKSNEPIANQENNHKKEGKLLSFSKAVSKDFERPGRRMFRALGFCANDL
jgi:iron-sulfur cluster repair protein YtfE (RIC family)